MKTTHKLNTKKATGVDNLPPKFLKWQLRQCQPHCQIFLTKVKNGQLPDDLKDAQVSPLFKKDDPFIKKNYRPVSILNSHSKIFERFNSLSVK